MPVSERVRRFMEQGSWIRRMFEEGMVLKQRHGAENVFDLSLGNPVMEPPAEFFEELRRIANNPTPGMHRYMPNAGYAETRGAVAEQLVRETGLAFTADEVLMTCGAGGALNVVLKSLLDPGDEVVIFAPYFVEYMFYADNHGGSCRSVPPDDRYYPDLAAFEKAITPRTRVVLVSSPNNPTGVLYDSGLLSRLAEIIAAKERQLGTEVFLVSDEPYRKILFDGLTYPHIFHHHVRSIVATSHSKDLALPGERIGYVAVHPEYDERAELMDALNFCNRTLGFVNAPRSDAAHRQDTPVGDSRRVRLPGQARFPVRQTHRDGVRDRKAAGSVLHVPALSNRGRRGVRRGAQEAPGACRAGEGFRAGRALPHIVLRGRQNAGGFDGRLPRSNRVRARVLTPPAAPTAAEHPSGPTR